MVLEGSRFFCETYAFEQFASTTCPPTSGIVDYNRVVIPPHRSLDPAPARLTPRARPRERRDGSRRHSTRGSTDDGDGDPEPPGGDTGRQCPAPGCSNELSGRQGTCSPRCRQRFSRARRAPKITVEVLEPARLDRMRALRVIWEGKHRGAVPQPDRPVLRRPAWSSKERAGLIRFAKRLGVELNDAQAGDLIDRCYDESPRELLRRMVAAARGERRPAPDRVRRDDQADVYCAHCALRRHPEVPACCLGAWLAQRGSVELLEAAA